MIRLHKVFLVAAILLLRSPAAAQQISPGQFGPALRQLLRQSFSPTDSQSYHAARHEMFGDFDNDHGGVVCVYTGVRHQTTDIPDHTIMNTEHTWPQSKFQGATNSQQMKSDLHHLYPTLSEVNADRGNNPYSEIPDVQTTNWWISDDAEHQIPTSGIDAYSESASGTFEPREDHKGNTARSLLYFFTIYEERGINLNWFQPQIPVLLAWHQQDPADAAEIARTQAINQVQGNANPFVLDASLAARIFQSSGGPSPSPAPLAIRRGNRLEAATRFTADATVAIETDLADLAEENRLLREIIIELELERARYMGAQQNSRLLHRRRQNK